MAVQNLREFTVRISDELRRNPERMKKIQQALVLEGGRYAARVTPVDTGRLRAAWFVEGGPGGDPGETGISRRARDARGRFTSGRAAQALSQATTNVAAAIPSIRPFTLTNIRNPVSYGTYVNGGGRVPGVFMVQRTFQRLKTIARGLTR